jgi:hypothetical protein
MLECTSKNAMIHQEKEHGLQSMLTCKGRQSVKNVSKILFVYKLKVIKFIFSHKKMVKM